jgi:hypothetical protein
VSTPHERPIPQAFYFRPGPPPSLSEALLAARARNAAAAALRAAAARIDDSTLVAELEAEATRLEAAALAPLVALSAEAGQ